MFLDVNALDLQDGHTSVRLEGVPDVCPRCHRNVHPRTVFSTILRERDLCQAIFRCTHQKCQEMFVATYRNEKRTAVSRPVYGLVSVAPWSAHQTEFPVTIQEVSPTFVEIYNQAIVAESQDLPQLVGIGLRKSLEFLVKDFAVAESPQREESIRTTQLGTCIAQFVSDVNVKECAKRAAWLGNDETHYTKKWETKDVSDLKLLVKLTVNWIDNVLLTKKYIAEMSANGA